MPTPCPLSVIYRPTDLGDRSTIPGVEARVSGEVLSLRSVTVEAGVNRHWSSNHRSREENEGGSVRRSAGLPAVSGQLRSVGKSLGSFLVT